MVAIGDMITVVAAADSSFTLVKEILDISPTGAFVAGTGGTRVWYRQEHEGVHWIRGVHMPSSRDVQAMLAAHRLVSG